MNPTNEVIAALDRLHNAREMQTLRAWLAEAKQTEMARAVKTEGSADVLRGRAQMLMEIEELFRTATDQMQRLEKRNGAQKQNYARNP